jgi:hypothetical protein
MIRIIRVTVRLSLAGDSVSDSGAGVPESDRQPGPGTVTEMRKRASVSCQ